MAACSTASLSADVRPLRDFPLQARRKVRFVLCDIDDTLTDDGRLTARAYDALERLHAAGLKVVPVTGRPAGWCDLIARFWPVDAVVGENGALYFAYDREERRMTRCYWKTERQRREDRERLALLEARILAAGARRRRRRRPGLSRGGPRDRLSRGRCSARGRRDRAHRRDLRGGRRAGQGQLDPCQRLVRRLRQARHEPTPAGRAGSASIGTQRARRCCSSAIRPTMRRCSPTSATL